MDLKSIVFAILAIILGEFALILFTTIAQELVFNGISYYTSPNSTIIFGGFLTFLAASGAGILSRIIGRHYTLTIPSVISFFIMLEMAYLIFSGITNDPVWFDLLAGSGLIIGIWIGYHYPEIKNSFVPKPNYHSTLQKD